MQRDVVGYIDATSNMNAGTASRPHPAGMPTGSTEWFPPNSYQAGRLDNAYRKRGLNPTKLVL